MDNIQKIKIDILDFIKRRWTRDSNWTNGNCMWFAIILKLRFPEVEVCYLPIPGHFVVEFNKEYFDWTGQVEVSNQPVNNFFELMKEDPLYAKRIIEACWR